MVKRALILLPLAYLWFRLILNLQVEWTTNPQYSFGWVVPFLCLGLLLRRWQAFPAHQGLGDGGCPPPATRLRTFDLCLLIPVIVFAFLYLPTRLIEAATPEWRPIQWLLAFEAIGLTLFAIYLGKGRASLRQFAFPICFFLVAVPWPSAIEIPIIQKLTQANASAVIEIMGILGVPAIQHGNLIEVGSGVVGIDEACSGIRSFQSSLMISLFFGEFYRLPWLQRLVLVPAGFILAFVFNICRTSLLTFLAAKKGVSAVSDYHDQAGLAILLACIATMWGVVLLLKWMGKKSETSSSDLKNRSAEFIPHDLTNPKTASPPLNSQASTLNPAPSDLSPVRHSLGEGGYFLLSTFRFSWILLTWLLAVELGVFLWYQKMEANLSVGPAWSLMFPEQNSSFNKVEMAKKTVDLLRFDEGKEGQWTENDGSQWHAFYFNWFPGRVAGYLAKRHTPEICFGATGSQLRSGPELMLLDVNNVLLPVRQYLYQNQGSLVHVFHCRWEAGASKDAYVQYESGRLNLIRAIWNGRGKQGQKVIEIVITGYADSAQAKEALVRKLNELIKVEKPL